MNFVTFLFQRRTGLVAKEPLFLQRFTPFQQGKPRLYPTLATSIHFAVQREQKNSQHFASSSPFTDQCHLRTLSKRCRAGDGNCGQQFEQSDSDRTRWKYASPGTVILVLSVLAATR
jgi:hypothetical protein